MKPTMIVIMGGQGVGKGTLSHMLMERGNYTYIESGEILRGADPESEIGQLIARGELVPDAQLFELMSQKISGAPGDIILDGFPRTTAQANWLVTQYADKYNIHIIYLCVSMEIMIQRIRKRINTGGGRADDANADAVQRRLKTFQEITMPAIEWLRTNPKIKFSTVDASGTIDENMNLMMQALALGYTAAQN